MIQTDEQSLIDATNKVTVSLLDKMANGETLKLNDQFKLYKYFDIEHFVLQDSKTDEDIFCVQYNGNDVVFTYL